MILYMKMLNHFTLMTMILCYIILSRRLRKRKRLSWDCHEISLIREVHFHRIIFISDLACDENIRMDRAAFHKLCTMLKIVGGLLPTKKYGCCRVSRHIFYIYWHIMLRIE